MMEKKRLYMIGNSHIDPVWFWNWEEGMQEVKATYASVLERMKEFEDFRFTSTSTAFLNGLKGFCRKCLRRSNSGWRKAVGRLREAGLLSRTVFCPAGRLLCGMDYMDSAT